MLKDITSVFNNPLTWYKGYTIIEIEYKDRLDIAKLSFNISYKSKELDNLITLIKEANPAVRLYDHKSCS